MSEMIGCQCGEDPVLTVSEAAALLRVNRKTVLRKIESGALRAGRVGQHGNWRVRRSAVLNLLVYPEESEQ